MSKGSKLPAMSAEGNVAHHIGNMVDRSFNRKATALCIAVLGISAWSGIIRFSEKKEPIRIPDTATEIEGGHKQVFVTDSIPVKQFIVPEVDSNDIDCGGITFTAMFDIDHKKSLELQPNGLVKVICENVTRNYPTEVISN